MAVTEFSFTVVSGTRDECMEEMDAITLQILQVIGGEPWLAIDDDVARQPLHNGPPITDNDFAYLGKKRMVFGGPSKLKPDTPLPEGVKPQHNDRMREEG